MKRVLIIWCVAMVAGVNATAQKNTIEPDSSKQRVLTFDEAVKIALQNGVLLNTQRNNLELSQMQKLSSIAGVGPNISANASTSQFNGNSFNSQTGQVVNGVRDNISGNINANLNLFSGFARMNGIRQYSNLLEAQSYFVKRTAEDVINLVATQYLQVMLDKELLRIARENLSVLNKQLNQVRETVVLGGRSPVEEYNQAALTKASELLFVQSEISLNNDKALLAQTLLMDAFEEFDTERPNWDLNAIGAEKLDPQEMADLAKLNRGDYLRAVKNERGYRFGMMSAKGLLLPSLSAFGSVGSSYNFQHNVPGIVSDRENVQTIVADPSAASGYSIQNTIVSTPITNPDIPQAFKQQFKVNNLYKQYGLQLSVPLFSGLSNRQFYISQKVLFENAVVQRKNVEFQVKNDVLRSIRNYDGAKKAFQITADKLSFAEKAVELETERYNLGVTNFVDFSNANRVVVQAQTDKAQAEYRLVFQKIILEYAVGMLKPEDISNATK
jgi:outer membrane protein